jgi:hypothetical protein
MTIDAKVFSLNFPTPAVVELVIRKKKGDMYYPICFVGFGRIIEDIKELGIDKTDKVRIAYTLKSKKFTSNNGVSRYSTSAIIDNVELLQKNANKQIEVVFVDSETGEILDNRKC